jgi:hypothetical protein
LHEVANKKWGDSVAYQQFLKDTPILIPFVRVHQAAIFVLPIAAVVCGALPGSSD